VTFLCDICINLYNIRQKLTISHLGRMRMNLHLPHLQQRNHNLHSVLSHLLPPHSPLLPLHQKHLHSHQLQLRHQARLNLRQHSGQHLETILRLLLHSPENHLLPLPPRQRLLVREMRRKIQQDLVYLRPRRMPVRNLLDRVLEIF
jgi:hypothetical protein